MAVGNADVNLGVRAFSKMLLHCLKYPQHAVNGVLLADERRKQATSDAQQTPQQQQLHIVDCVPLFHQCLGLTPMMEVALAQIDQYCKTSGLVIAGYYQANEHLRDSAPDAIAYRVADKIAENFSEACLIMIDNESVAVHLDKAPLVVYGSQDGRWRERICRLAEKTLDVTSSLLRGKKYRSLTDFDNHLDDVHRSWWNHEIDEEIARCL